MNDKNSEILNALQHWYDDYCKSTSRNEKERIESSVRHYASNLPGDIYVELNENAGSGLFRHGFFQSDMERCLRILKEKNKNE